LDISLSVNAQGLFDKAGAATINGTLMCNNEASFADVFVRLRQRAGRHFITGELSVGIDPCSPPSSSWSATVIGDGVFRGGSVMAEVFAFSCDDFSCDEDSVNMTIRLKGGKKN
jgi:hypothetical protein